MIDSFYFLSSEDEAKIKSEYEQEKRFGRIDTDIIPMIDKLNSIKGLVSLYSCQGHRHTPRSYIVLKFNKRLTVAVTEAIKELMLEVDDVRVDWNHTVNCNVNNDKTLHVATIVRGGMDCNYMNLLFEKIYKLIK